jgi:lipopolysaccharide transport system permease protein
MASIRSLAAELFGVLSPRAAFKSAWSHRALIGRLAQREIEARYRGSVLGLVWSALIPVLLLAVYTFVFSVVFSVRWGGSQLESRGHFALMLFCGLVLYNLFSECVNRAPGLMLSNVTYIKKVIFPLETLPWVTLLAASFNFLVSFVVLMAGYIALIGLPPWTILYLPVICLPLLLMTVGISLFLASIGVFIRDLQQLVGIFTMILMFMSPIFYPISAIPPEYRIVVQLSPISVSIEQARAALFTGSGPDPATWFASFGAALVAVWLGHAWFMRTKKGFADVV